MREISKHIFIVSFYLASCTPSADPKPQQAFSKKIENLVIDEHRPGQEYRFEEVKDKGILQYSIIYIGSLKKSNHDSLQVLYKTVLSGNETPQANSYLVFFDKHDKCIGRYDIGSKDIPVVSNAHLIFKDSFGDCTETTTISFKDSIPAVIFIHCKPENGKMYGDEFGFLPEDTL